MKLYPIAAVVIVSILPPAPLATLQSSQNTCSFTDPCDGTPFCGDNCNVELKVGPEFFISNPEGGDPICKTKIKMKATCNNGSGTVTTCELEETRNCDNADPMSLTCDACVFSSDPDSTGSSGDCQGATWADMGAGFRCPCYKPTCAEPQ